MTREEQIMKIGAQFAIDETDGQTSGRAASMRGVLLSAFRAGAHWADQHPQWISVEDELPPFDWKEDGSWRRSLPVLIYDPTRGIFVGCYESDDLYGKTYWIYDNGKRPTKEVSGGYEWDNVTHWMPIVPPRKEDKQ